MRRVLLVQPSIEPPGGGNAVAAWMLEALRGDHALTLLCWRPPDLDAVNRIYGTSLRAGDFALRAPPARLRAIADAAPLSLALLKSALLRRTLAQLCRREHFDVLLGANNEFDFGRRGIQYVHYPADKLPRPAQELRWYHRPPGFVTVYRALSRRLSGSSLQRIRSNLTLANSRYIAGEIRAWHGIEARVVFPPVAGDFSKAAATDWSERDNGFVCIGRISPEKELERVIAIVAGVRDRGHSVRLHLVGDGGRGEYAARIRETAGRSDWIELHTEISRAALIELLSRNRFGIHGMRGEHFGIAVAELQRAGCIPFVPDDAGPAEIVDDDARIVYASVDDAVAKIDRVLRDDALCRAIRADCDARRDRFSAQRFGREIRALVAGFSAR